MVCDSLNNYRFKDGSLVGYIYRINGLGLLDMEEINVNNFSICKVKPPGGAKVG